MKIYKIAQAVQPVDQQAIQEIIYAYQQITYSVANINESIKIIEKTGVGQLFQKENLIKAIQSGDMAQLDVATNINPALEAMTHIAQAVPILNDALRVIEANPQAAEAVKLDSKVIYNNIITSLQSGDYSQFQSSLAGFQNSMMGMSGTIGTAVGI